MLIFAFQFKSPGGGIGRRAGLKHQFLHGSVGSTPTLGTLQSYCIENQGKECNNVALSAHILPNAIDQEIRYVEDLSSMDWVVTKVSKWQ